MITRDAFELGVRLLVGLVLVASQVLCCLALLALCICIGISCCFSFKFASVQLPMSRRGLMSQHGYNQNPGVGSWLVLFWFRVGPCQVSCWFRFVLVMFRVGSVVGFCVGRGPLAKYSRSGKSPCWLFLLAFPVGSPCWPPC